MSSGGVLRGQILGETLPMVTTYHRIGSSKSNIDDTNVAQCSLILPQEWRACIKVWYAQPVPMEKESPGKSHRLIPIGPRIPKGFGDRASTITEAGSLEKQIKHSVCEPPIRQSPFRTEV